MFGEKMKKLRTDNHLTQEELAERILVTRTAVSKWENNKGYPSVDSLKELSRLFGISIDELISDEDVENKKLLDEARSRKCYWGAMGCLCMTVAGTLLSFFTRIPNMGIVSVFGVVGYVVLGLLSKPKYKRQAARKLILPYVFSRLVVLVIVIAVLVSAIVQLNG